MKELEAEFNHFLDETEGNPRMWHSEEQKEWALDIARHFANWQKKQMEKHRIEHCHSITNEQAELEDNFVSSHIDKNNRMPTFLDAIEYGMSLQREQMLKDAVEGFIAAYPYADGIEIMFGGKHQDIIGKYKKHDKVKVIIVKEG